MLQQIKTVLVLGSAVLFITACGKESGSGDSTQVAAKVNSGEVTVHQLNYELALAARRNPKINAETSARPALEQLVNQELLLQKAEDAELDRNPNVLQAIERAKRQVLVQAYLDSIYSSISPPGEMEMQKFYDENPLLFKQRHFYQIQQFSFAKDVDLAKVEDKVVGSKDIKEFVKWLKDEKISARGKSSSNPAERIPMSLLPTLAKVKDGKGVMVHLPQGSVAVWRLASKEVPMTFEQAKPFITQFLVKKARSERANQEVTVLRQAATIEFKGQFASSAAESPQVTTTALPGDISEQEESDELDDAAIEKGMTGLK